MKYFLVFCLFTLLPALHSAPPTPPKKPPTREQVNTELLAKAALLADPLTGEVLYARDIDTPYPPASTVKLMTALVAYRKTGGQGYPTEINKGRWSGFFHGVGHGLGLEIHEAPRFATPSLPLGAVITVEPGLYLPGIGGVRIEDVVVVGRKAARKLTRFPNVWEIR